MKFEDGKKYEGTWNEDHMEGEGALFYTDGSKYVGQWHKDIKNGIGTKYYTNDWQNANQDNYFLKSCYHGQWKDGKKHGKGTLLDEEGNGKESLWD